MLRVSEKTYISETNAAAIMVLIGWLVAHFGFDVPADVSLAIGGIVIAVANFGIRILNKKGLI